MPARDASAWIPFSVETTFFCLAVVPSWVAAAGIDAGLPRASSAFTMPRRLCTPRWAPRAAPVALSESEVLISKNVREGRHNHEIA